MDEFWTIVKLVFLSSYWCVGLHMNSEHGDIFYFLRRGLAKKPDWIYKPVIGCVNCMAGVHTIIVMVLYNYLDGLPVLLWWKYILLWLLVAVITSGINGIVYTFYLLMREYIATLSDDDDAVD